VVEAPRTCHGASSSCRRSARNCQVNSTPSGRANLQPRT
jgi:hypothetical protein